MRLRGIDRLRVVDASVMPNFVGGNINAVVIIIAEKAADLTSVIPPLPGSRSNPGSSIAIPAQASAACLLLGVEP